jgi:hypothetical protein
MTLLELVQELVQGLEIEKKIFIRYFPSRQVLYYSFMQKKYSLILLIILILNDILKI